MHVAPPAPADLSPLARMVRSEAFPGVLLVLAAAVALVAANSPFAEAWEHLWETPLSLRLGDVGLTKPVHHWINDGLMVLFFFFVGLEIKHELLDGDLRSVRRAALPDGVGWRHLHGAAWLAGIGFTMSLFVDGLAFASQGEAFLASKIAVLGASLLAGVVGAIVLLRAAARGAAAPASPS